MDRANIRMMRELEMLSNDPPPGISCYAVAEKINELEATIIGCEDSPYADGVFILSIIIPKRYPFEPPAMKFKTQIYHPNIDCAGRICLDLLKMPPKGSWKPSLNISTLLKSVQLLMNHPNPEDPLMADIAQEFTSDKYLFNKKAREWTKRFANDDKKSRKRQTETKTLAGQSPSKQRILKDAN